MEMIISKKSLREALSVLLKVVPRKATLPILEGVRIDATEDSVSATATNLDETLTWMIPGGWGTGSFVVGFRELKEFAAQGGSAGEVAFGSSGGSVKASYISNGLTVERSFKAFPLNDWPDGARCLKDRRPVKGALFDAIRKALPSVSSDPTRQVLQCVLLDKNAVVATNGSQLVKFDVDTGVEGKCLVSATKFISSKHFTVGDGWLAADDRRNPGWLEFQTKTWRYSLKLTVGTYPDYARVIPKECSASLELSSKAMERLRDAVPLLQCSSELQTVHIHAGVGGFMVMPEKLENPGVLVDCSFTDVSNEALAISIDKRLLVRALKLGFSVFKWTPGDPHAPVTATDGKGSELFVFMPLRGGKPEAIKKAAAKFGRVDGRATADAGNSRSGVPSESAPETIQPAAKGKDSRRDEKENMKMVDESKIENKRSGFTVVDGTEGDPFIRLQQEIMITQEQAKAVVDHAKQLSRLVRDVQREVRSREKDFKNTRELLGRLKKVSGF